MRSQEDNNGAVILSEAKNLAMVDDANDKNSALNLESGRNDFGPYLLCSALAAPIATR